MYTFALFIGAISGSIASQAVFSSMVFILPIGSWELVDNLLRVHSILYRDKFYSSVNEIFQDYFNLINFIGAQYDFISLTHVIIMGLILLLTAWGGIRAYERNRAENNGKLLIFRLWERIAAVGFVVYFSMLSASMASGMFGLNNQQIIYDMGLVVGVFLGIFIVRRLTRLRLKI